MQRHRDGRHAVEQVVVRRWDGARIYYPTQKLVAGAPSECLASFQLLLRTALHGRRCS